jgi:hypothetical protein
VRYSVRGHLPTWLSWESDSVLGGSAPPSANNERYKALITVAANYTMFGMSHTIESRMELDIRPPGSHVADTNVPAGSAAQATAGPTSGMEHTMDTTLDDDGEELSFQGQTAFSSGYTTPQSAATPGLTNPAPFLYLSNQSLQNTPLRQGIGPTPSPVPGGVVGGGMTITPAQALTPTISPGSAQFNPYTAPRPPSSGPQTPLGGRPSPQLSLHLTHLTHDSSSGSLVAHPYASHFTNGHLMYDPPLHAEPNGLILGFDDMSDSSNKSQVYFEEHSRF